MDNEERIKRWRQQRQSPQPSPALPEDEDFADLDTVALNRPDPGERTGSATPGGRSHEISLEEARLAIRQRRRERWRLLTRRLAFYVGIPLLAILAYVAFIATPLYQGEAVFTVQTSQEAPPAAAAGGLIGLGVSTPGIADAFKAREFILSRSMMNYMEQRYGFMSHFASPAMDPLERYRSPLGLNRDPLTYYRKRVRVAVDTQEGMLRLFVQARTPQDAQKFGDAILAASERHVNEFSERMTADQISALSRDVQNAEREVSEARRGLAIVQARRGDLNPEQTAAAIYQLISSLELQLADAQRERNALLDQGLTNSPLLPRLTTRVQELQSQISQQRQRLTNPGGGSVARSVNEFESAASRKEIAQARYDTTLKTLQQAYLKILGERRYFVIIVQMGVDTYAAVRDIITISWPILLFLALLWAIVAIARRSSADRRWLDSLRFGWTVRQWRRS
jgi:capsular polysaccharide transport system permease protein